MALTGLVAPSTVTLCTISLGSLVDNETSSPHMLSSRGHLTLFVLVLLLLPFLIIPLLPSPPLLPVAMFGSRVHRKSGRHPTPARATSLFLASPCHARRPHDSGAGLRSPTGERGPRAGTPVRPPCSGRRSVSVLFPGTRFAEVDVFRTFGNGGRTFRATSGPQRGPFRGPFRTLFVQPSTAPHLSPPPISERPRHWTTSA